MHRQSVLVLTLALCLTCLAQPSKDGSAEKEQQVKEEKNVNEARPDEKTSVKRQKNDEKTSEKGQIAKEKTVRKKGSSTEKTTTRKEQLSNKTSAKGPKRRRKHWRRRVRHNVTLNPEDVQLFEELIRKHRQSTIKVTRGPDFYKNLTKRPKFKKRGGKKGYPDRSDTHLNLKKIDPALIERSNKVNESLFWYESDEREKNKKTTLMRKGVLRRRLNKIKNREKLERRRMFKKLGYPPSNKTKKKEEEIDMRFVDKEQIDDLVQRMVWQKHLEAEGVLPPGARPEELDPEKKFGYSKRARIINTATKKYRARNPAPRRTTQMPGVSRIKKYVEEPGDRANGTGRVVGRKGWTIPPRYLGRRLPPKKRATVADWLIKKMMEKQIATATTPGRVLDSLKKGASKYKTKSSTDSTMTSNFKVAEP